MKINTASRGKARFYVGAGIAALGLAALAAPAQAQDADAEEEEATAAPSDSSPIIVSGTRIRTPNLTSPEPITTLNNEVLRERNFTNIADALNELPGVRGSVTPAGGQGFGQGVNFINNYGLGSNRTLTLVNGRRFVSSNVATIFTNAGSGTQVDLNVIPSILVDRIDSISVGGAPLYGSDAISGTLNVVLRSEFDGVEVAGTSGISEEGDNANYNLSAIAGRSFLDGRLNITVAASHDDIKGMVYNDREFLRRRIGGATNPSPAQAAALRPGSTFGNNDGRLNTGIGFNSGPADGTPGVVQIRNVNIPYLTPGGLITATNLATADPRNPAVPFGVPTTRGLQFDTQGNLVPFNQGIVFPGTSGSGGDGFTFADYTQITSDLKRTTINGFLTFEIAPSIELFAEGTYFESRADELVQQPTFNSSLFGGLSGPLTFSVNNPFLTDQARNELVSRGVSLFQVSRASDDFADLTGFNKTQIYYGTGGVRGDFELLGNAWNFEAFASHGKTRSRDFGQDLNAQNFVNATNVTTNAAGQIVCTTDQTRPGGFAAPGRNPIADANCVPLNLFGNGRASRAALDYIIEDFVTVSEQQQTVFNANVGGALFDLWGAGPVAINVGYEHRDEKASFTPSDFQQQGRGRSVAITPLSGKYNLDEVFGEMSIPLVSPDNNIPFIYSAQLFGRGRYTHNSINGGQFSYTAGGTFAPIADVQFRGNYTRSFRAPGITELFLPQVNTFAFVPDLCQDAAIGLGAAPDLRRRNCTAFRNAFAGTDFASPDPASTASVPARSGGNPNLENEEAESYTFGVIFQPSFIPRLAISADYVNITLTGPISNLTVAQIASGCFDNEVFDTSDVLNANSFCSRINRDPNTGRVVGDPQNPAVVSGFVNGQEIKFSGIQGTLGYSVPMSGIGLDGTLSLGGDMLYVRRRLVNITGVAPARSDGVIGDPEFSGQLRMRYVEANFGVNVNVNYTGEQLFSRQNREIGQPSQGLDAREIDELDDYVTVSGSIFFDATDDFRLTLAVNNLFNRQGQMYQGELLPASYNDLIGRRFSVSARMRF
ncbi:TonB-dependent receptor [Altererythrobacter sp. H2]|uniref:TonB-dependent receptor domain-containing protein n=1 Tax=Altererythrobacter sp. H2 TaxID=3108391 RepID=UPI002B4C22E7|nr:TonB-dependent receptor [Altererythrobacter sp. H2]WRK95405.1 TonB-dependent receptor [Altererythrobacter sp. H2]